MNRIDEVFTGLKAANGTALIAYIMAGYPDGIATETLIESIAAAGADIIEIGIPFSDPLADGATIQKASEAALAGGMTTDQALKAVAKARAKTQIPVLIMTYYNIILRYGPERFAKAAAEAGVDGAIVPDLPPEEADRWREAAGEHGLCTVFLVAPTSSAGRIRQAAEASAGFVYCVSLAGVTGGRSELAKGLPEFIKSVKNATDKPVAVGFGVSTPAQAGELARLADGVIVGSALIDKMAAGGDQGIAAATAFISELKSNMREEGGLRT